MTTEQHMLASPFRVRPARPARVVAALLFVGILAIGCQSPRDDLRFPSSLVAPYDSIDGDVLWAVAPLRNESGVSVVDTLAVADTLAATFEETRGVSVAPVNRTIGAMRSMGLDRVASAADARRLATQMGVDAIVVGTVTAWQPYDPPQLGLSLALYDGAGTGRLAGQTVQIDPRALESSTTDSPPATTRVKADAPLSVAAEHLDGANHEVQLAVRAYAEGRNDPASALGWKRYLASMSLFTKFASYRLASRLLDQERLRLARQRASQQALAR